LQASLDNAGVEVAFVEAKVLAVCAAESGDAVEEFVIAGDRGVVDTVVTTVAGALRRVKQEAVGREEGVESVGFAFPIRAHAAEEIDAAAGGEEGVEGTFFDGPVWLIEDGTDEDTVERSKFFSGPVRVLRDGDVEACAGE